MVKLNSLKCTLEVGQPPSPLSEYGTVYGDGVVETYAALPTSPGTFSVCLTASNPLVSGLAMFVFVDGVFHCNRNYVSLTSDTIDKVEFRVRQKEERFEASRSISREWSFEAVNAVADFDTTDAEQEILESIGTIEVVVLRCRPGPNQYTVPEKSDPSRRPARGQIDGAADSDSDSDSDSESPTHRHGVKDFPRATLFPQLDGSRDSDHRSHRHRRHHRRHRSGTSHTQSPMVTAPLPPQMPWYPYNYPPAPYPYYPPQYGAHPPIQGAGAETAVMIGTGRVIEVGPQGTRRRSHHTASRIGSRASSKSSSRKSSKSSKKDDINDNTWNNDINATTWGNDAKATTAQDSSWPAQTTENPATDSTGPAQPTNTTNIDSSWPPQTTTNPAIDTSWPPKTTTTPPAQPTTTPKPTTAKPSSTPRSTASSPPLGPIDPTRPHIKRYWQTWDTPVPAPSNSSNDADPLADLYTSPALPATPVPQTVVDAANLTHQVVAGRGVLWAGRTARVRYLDRFEEPFAVFVFRYRSRAAIERILGITIADEDEGSVRRAVQGMTREEMVEALIEERMGRRAGAGVGDKVGKTEMKKRVMTAATVAAEPAKVDAAVDKVASEKPKTFINKMGWEEGVEPASGW